MHIKKLSRHLMLAAGVVVYTHVHKGDRYVDPGIVEAYDPCMVGGVEVGPRVDLTARVKTTGADKVRADKVGKKYTVTYTVTDDGGNTTTATRIVEVVK